MTCGSSSRCILIPVASSYAMEILNLVQENCVYLLRNKDRTVLCENKHVVLPHRYIEGKKSLTRGQSPAKVKIP